MIQEWQVQRAGLNGDRWQTVCRGQEPQARTVFQKQLTLSSIGRFRLVRPDGSVAAQENAKPLFA